MGDYLFKSLCGNERAPGQNSSVPPIAVRRGREKSISLRRMNRRNTSDHMTRSVQSGGRQFRAWLAQPGLTLPAGLSGAANGNVETHETERAPDQTGALLKRFDDPA